ncbi:hypothetical protein [Paractinoplanes atraurantiacus]|uniref:Uncharacterized protein n=1 Tax=Paractinoplanes atraurantiacus TaxID=1036182 RepID=A0A285HR99_9ACTN|nr:hypothetical protein [Actinoplanes atraurantiacus]SNY37241.1 hypothetical protein SAMN05421748_10558 [Actinoplanes atraurantiacus]
MTIDETVTTTPETPRQRLRETIASGASKAPAAVRRNKVPAAGALAAVGGVIAVLLVRRRAARAKARSRWVPARFQR